MEIMKDERFGALGDPRYLEYAGLAHDATSRMIRLCDRLLVSPLANMDVPRVAVAGLIDQVAAMYQPMAEARGVELRVDLAESLPDLRVDAEALTTVLSNLVTNAIKFTPKGGRVTLAARREPLENVAVFVVSDTGTGLDADQLAEDMQPHPAEGVASVGVHGDTGSGLGLAIVRKVVSAIGGTLELRSRAGVGTCAIVRLPLGGGAASG